MRPLLRILKTFGCVVASVDWPSEKKKAHNLKASVSVARKKVREQLKEVNLV
jgi:hypothetical protein